VPVPFTVESYFVVGGCLRQQLLNCKYPTTMIIQCTHNTGWFGCFIYPKRHRVPLKLRQPRYQPHYEESQSRKLLLSWYPNKTTTTKSKQAWAWWGFLKITVKESRNRPGVAHKVPGGLNSQISRHSTREGGEVVSLTHRPPLPPGMFLVLIFTRGWVDPRAMVRSEGNTSLKNPVTPPGDRSRDRPTSSAAP
jgi:hypothetical protein